jgi:hypothetical protein
MSTTGMSSGSATSIRLSGATIVTRQKPRPAPEAAPGPCPAPVAAAEAVMLT